MEDPLKFVAIVFFVVAAIIGAVIWHDARNQTASNKLCAEKGMTSTDITQGTGKGRHSVYLCRAESGQLYSF